MSLSFVASTVQTATADGGYEETQIEATANVVDALNKRNANKPLFEQLRQNQEEEQARQDEIQREIMRGTCALDEDDVAHLEALERQRLDKERTIQQRTMDELAQFRAARAERKQGILLEGESDSAAEDNDDDDDGNGDNDGKRVVEPLSSAAVGPLAQQPSINNHASKKEPGLPKIVVKKRKRRVDGSKDPNKTPKVEGSSANTKTSKPVSQPPSDVELASQSDDKPTPLNSLLSGYGSSDDSSAS